MKRQAYSSTFYKKNFIFIVSNFSVHLSNVACRITSLHRYIITYAFIIICAMRCSSSNPGQRFVFSYILILYFFCLSKLIANMNIDAFVIRFQRSIVWIYALAFINGNDFVIFLLWILLILFSCLLKLFSQIPKLVTHYVN